MAIEKGQKAPDFTLFDSDKQKVSLADYKGKHSKYGLRHRLVRRLRRNENVQTAE